MHAMQEDAGSHNHDPSSGANGHADAGTSVSQRKAKGPQMRDTMATMVGMLIPLLTQVWH
jgi:zinc transporter 9